MRRLQEKCHGQVGDSGIFSYALEALCHNALTCRTVVDPVTGIAHCLSKAMARRDVPTPSCASTSVAKG